MITPDRRRTSARPWLRVLPLLVIIIAPHAYSADPTLPPSPGGAPWWDARWGARRQITVTNSLSAKNIPTAYSTRVILDHATLVSASLSQADGDDVRIVFWNGSQNIELDRAVGGPELVSPGGAGDWDTATTRIWFATQAEIGASGDDDRYYIYYDNSAAANPPSDRSNIYLWYDDFSTNQIGGTPWANGVVSSTSVTNDFMAINLQTAGNAAVMAAGGELILDMGPGEEISDGTGNDVRVYETGGGETYEVFASNSSTGPWNSLGQSALAQGEFNLNGSGLTEARYIRITQVTGTPDIEAVEALNRNSIPSAQVKYVNGRMNDIHGTLVQQIWWDPVDQVARFDTADNAEAGLRVSALNLADVLVQVDMNVFRTYPVNGTACLIARYSDPNTHYWANIENSTDNDYTQSPGVARADTGTITTASNVAGPGTDPTWCGVANGSGSTTPKTSTSNACAYTDAGHRLRYGIFQVDATTSSHRFWINEDTDDTTPLVQNQSYTDDGYAASGQPGIQAAQQWGHFDNLVVRYYVDAEPTTSTGTAQTLSENKVTGLHTFTTSVAPGESNVQILRLDIATGSSETLQSLTVTSQNTSDSDVTGVSAYYTGPTPTFETTSPFGTTNQAFSSGTVTFTGSKSLPDNSVVHVYIVYNVAGGATVSNLLDATIAATDVTISGTDYPATATIDPTGSRAIQAAQAPGTVTAAHTNTGDVRPGDTDRNILRVAFPVTGTGSPQTLTRIKVTAQNDADSDVSGVSAYYLGTSSSFGARTEVFDDDFQAYTVGSDPGGSWQIEDLGGNGDDVDVANFSGSKAAHLQDDGSAIKININTTGRSGIQFSLTAGVSELEPPDNPAVIQWSPTGDSGYITLQSLDDNDDNIYAVRTFVLPPSADDNPNVYIRIATGSNWSDTDELYVDDVTVTSNRVTFGTGGQPLAGGTVTFNGTVDFVQPNKTHYVFITYNIDNDAIVGNTVDARIVADDITVEGVTVPATAQNPAGTRTIDVPTGEVENMAPTAFRVDSNPTLDNAVQTSFGAVADLATDNGAYAGMSIDNVGITGVTQEIWTEFTYDILSAGIVLFNDDFEAYVVGADPGAPWQIEDAPNGDDVNVANFGGSQAGHLQDDGSALKVNINTTGRQNIVVAVRVALTGIEANDQPFVVSWSPNGDTDYRVLESFADGQDTGVFLSRQYRLPSSAENNANVYLKFSTGADWSNGDDAYIDNVRVIADPPTGRDINSLTFEAEMYMHGAAGTNTPLGATDVAEYDAVNDARVQIYNHTTSAWEDMGPAFLRPTGSNWEAPPTAQSEGLVWDETGDDNPERLLLRSKYEGFSDDYVNPQGELRVRVWVSAGFDDTGDDVVWPIDRATIDFSYGSNLEQAAYQWAGNDENQWANVNAHARVAVNDQLHLRVGVRSNFKLSPFEYLGIQYDTDPAFGSPTLMTTSTADLRYWDDPDHSEGDSVSPAIIAGTLTAGIYYEDQVPPTLSHNPNILYEQDFSVEVVTANTYYLRVVRVDSGGTLIGPLDAYNPLIELRAASLVISQTAYDWAVDTAGDETALDFDSGSSVGGTTDNVPLDFVVGTTYFLAIQLDHAPGQNLPSRDMQLQYQETTGGSPGSWVSMQQGGSGDWTMIDDASTTNTIANGVAFTLPLGCDAPADGSPPNAGGGEYSDDGTSTDDPGGVNEYWEGLFSIQPQAGARGKSYRFRILIRLADGSLQSGVSYDNYAEARQDPHEQLSYRLTGENEAPLADENTAADVAIDQLLHVRVGLIARNKDWNSADIALQYDDNSGFTSPTLMTTGTTEVAMWDDGDRTEGATVASVLLSGTPTAGTYHEDNDQPASVNYLADVLYEEDFTIQVKQAGTFYIRVVEVDTSGGSPTVLTAPSGHDPYTNIIELTASAPPAAQTFYNWATDATSPTFNGTNAELELSTGQNYILAVQAENRTGSAVNYNWQLQFQRVSGVPGSWTSITTSSSDWRAVNGTFGIDLDPVTPGNFVTNSGNPFTSGLTAVNGVYSETGTFSASLAGNSYTEYWYQIQAQSESFQNRYRFRLTDGGSAAPIIFDVYPIARDTYTEEVTYRWTNVIENPVADENAIFNATVNEFMHLRTAVRSNNGPTSNIRLGLQLDDNTNFTSPVMVTTTSADVRYWNDAAHAEGDPVTGLVTSGSPTAGIYHEDDIPPTANLAQDTLVEEDFAVQIISLGTFYMRVVEVDASGNFIQALDYFPTIISVTGNPPTAEQHSYNWGAGELAAGSGFGTADQSLEFATSTTYTFAIRVGNVSGASVTYDWQLEYQKANGTPGAWTAVTTSSTDWRAVAGGTAQDGNAVTTGNFVTNSGGGTAINGIYSEDGLISGFMIDTGEETEFRFEIQPQGAAAGNSYRFRLTNSGSNTGFIYTVLGSAQQTIHEQTGYRWADENNSPLQPENTPFTAAIDQKLHLRIGVRSNNNGWGTHYLAVQYDTNSSFSSPTLVTTGTATVFMWDDLDHAADSTVGSLLMTGSSAGLHHESNVTAAQTKGADVLTEEDFTVQIDTAGTYYLRVVEVDSGGNFVQAVDLYSQTIEVTVVDPNLDQNAYEWMVNTAIPDSSGPSNTIQEFQIGTIYIVAVRIENFGTDPSTLNWRLEYQEDPTGSPGAWTSVTTTSSDWRAVDGVYAADDATVATSDFVTGSLPATATAGVYSEDGVVSGFTLAAGQYTEHWFSIRAIASTALKRYRFRVSDNGNNGPFVYSIYPHAAQRVREQIAFRWADQNELAIESEDTAMSIAADTLVRVRASIRSQHLDWNGHHLALEFDDNSSFSSPTLMTGATADIRGWNDTDFNDGHADGDSPVTPILISGSPSGGMYHEDNLTPTSQSKTAGTVYEEDFTVRPSTVGTWYLRVVEVDSSGLNPVTLDTYGPVIELTVAAQVDEVAAYNWAPDAASLTFGTENTSLFYQAGNKYILAIRLDHVNPDSAYDWKLQYQKDPNGTPGPWTTITNASSDWRTATTGTYVAKSNGDAVASGDRGTTGGNTYTNGVYWNDSTDNSFTLSGNPGTTELWYRLEADATNTEGEQYRFRITNSGSTSGFTYTFHPEACNFKKISSGNWDTDADWTPTGKPTSTENALVLGPVSMNTAAATAKTVRIINGATLTSAASTTLTVSNELQVQSGGTLVVSATASQIDVSSTATVDAGATLQLGTGGSLRMADGESLIVNGTLTASGTSTITRSGGTGTIDVVLNGTVNITGLTFSYGDTEGLDISSSATIQNLSGITFNNLNTATGSRYLTITKAALSLDANGNFFDTGPNGTTLFNVRLVDTDGGGDTFVRMQFMDTTTNGAGAGESFDEEVNSAVVDWFYAIQTGVSGTPVNFIAPAFDLNTFAHYATYAVFTDASGTTDTIYVLDENGNLQGYSFTVPQAEGDIVGGVFWYTEGTDHTLYFGTSGGFLYKLRDTGAAFVTEWSVDGSTLVGPDTPFIEVTSKIVSDGTNVYFGGREVATTYRVYAHALSDGSQVFARSVPSRIETHPTLDTSTGSTLLYMGGDDDGTYGHIFRFDVANAANDLDNPPTAGDRPTDHVRAAMGLRFDGTRLHVGDFDGRMHGIDPLDASFDVLTGWPIVTPPHAVGDVTLPSGPWVESFQTILYWGDSDGHVVAANFDGTIISGWPIQPEAGFAIFATPLAADGVMYVPTGNGKVFAVDISTATVIQTLDFGTGTTISHLSYQFTIDAYLVATNTGRVFYFSPVTDPTP